MILFFPSPVYRGICPRQAFSSSQILLGLFSGTRSSCTMCGSVYWPRCITVRLGWTRSVDSDACFDSHRVVRTLLFRNDTRFVRNCFAIFASPAVFLPMPWGKYTALY
ncbi:hypothetical protein CC77DRAFT_597934 [Alternaria alternata]|uniref:Uncharacterized protein n=1 Tax=Alternaria alternata TaxID=5599 RepID=A0A177D4A2_ALTAL|nr:hypothetical protein CC77DRAFT_597934 [Alternaria alternata]OAG13799.1 hypothetical protein CC77DRAFT_597934 [Alternaria alternata]